MLHTALKHETYMYIVHYTTLKHVRAVSGRGGGIGVVCRMFANYLHSALNMELSWALSAVTV